jgi:hypothetical protein
MVFGDNTERLLGLLASLVDMGEEGRSLLRAALRREDGNALHVLSDWMEERGYRRPVPSRRTLPESHVINERRQAIMVVSWDLLRSILLLPPECSLMGISTDLRFRNDEVAIKVASPDFPPTEPGSVLPYVTARYSTIEENGKRVGRFDGWTW